MPDSRKRSPPSDDAEDAPKRKRRAYTRNACTFCQSRKVKCSGTQPCARCDELGEACTYAQSDSKDGVPDQPRKLDNSVQTLVEYLSLLNGKMDSMLSQVAPRNTSTVTLGGLSGRTRPTPMSRKSSHSSIQSLRRAAAILTPRGLQSGSPSSAATPRASLANGATPLPIAALSLAAEPIIALGRDEATLYLDLFASEVLGIYPVVSLPEVRSKLDTLFQSFPTHTPAASRMQHLTSMDIELLKIILAIGASSQAEDATSLGQNLRSHLLWSIEQILDQDGPDLDDITSSFLLSLYFLQLNECGKAWRMIGLTARMSLELGLDNVATFSEAIPSGSDRDRRIVLFCCIVDLDSRCALTVNLPRALEDYKLEAGMLPSTPTYAHLRALVDIDRILEEFDDRMEVRKEMSIATDEGPERHDYHLRKTLELILKGFPPFPPSAPDPAPEYSIRSYMQLRTHYGRLLSHMPFISASKPVRIEPKAAQNLIAAARDIVGAYRFAIESYRIIKHLRPTFDQFLYNAVSVLHMASTMYSVQYASLCVDSLRVGLEMLSMLPQRPVGMGNTPLSVKDPAAVSSDLSRELNGIYQENQETGEQHLSSEGLETFTLDAPPNLSEWDWANIDMQLPDPHLNPFCGFDGDLPTLPMNSQALI